MTKLAIAVSKESLKKLIGEFYYSSPDNIELRDKGTVFNTKLNKQLTTSWSEVKGRYIFWS